jgi:hypothetical protein
MSADFAVGGTNGQLIIEAEIEFQKFKLEAALPADALQMLAQVNGEVVSVNPSGLFTPTLYADNVRAYVVDKGYTPCPGKSYEQTDMCWQSLQNDQLIVTTANISGLSNNNYVLLDDFDAKNQNLVLYYEVNTANLTLTSLKSILRDMVCCSLGSRLYPAADADAWSVVKHYCTEAEKWISYFEDGNLPAEMKKMKLINKTRGIGSMRLVRG